MFKIFSTYICWINKKIQHLEVSGAVRPLKWSLGVKWLKPLKFFLTNWLWKETLNFQALRVFVPFRHVKVIPTFRPCFVSLILMIKRSRCPWTWRNTETLVTLYYSSRRHVTHDLKINPHPCDSLCPGKWHFVIPIYTRQSLKAFRGHLRGFWATYEACSKKDRTF